MVQNVIVAQRVFSESKSAEVWKVAVLSTSGKMLASRNCTEPLKAMRYMFLLKAKLGVTISELSLAMLQIEHQQLKAQLKEVPAEEKAMLHEIAQELLTGEAEPTKKSTRRGRKSSKMKEVEA